MKRGDFRSRIDQKPTLNEKSTLRKKTRADLLERKGKRATKIIFRSTLSSIYIFYTFYFFS